MKQNAVRESLNLTPNNNAEVHCEELLTSLAGSWFSTSLSTESMMRGTINEDSVLSPCPGRSLL